MFARLFAALVLVLAPLPALAQQPSADLIAGQEYDPAIPTPERVLGYAFGERLSRASDVLRYFDALSEAAPDRMMLTRYGETWEGRPLPYAVITSAANMRRIGTIRDASLALTDPGGLRRSIST